MRPLESKVSPGSHDAATVALLLAELPDPATMRDVATACGVSYSTVSCWVTDGKLPATKINGRSDGIRWLISGDDVRAFLTAPADAVTCPECKKPDQVTKRRGDRTLMFDETKDAVPAIKQSYECGRCDVKFNRRISVEWSGAAE